MSLCMIRMNMLRMVRRMCLPSKEMIDDVVHKSYEVPKDPM